MNTLQRNKEIVHRRKAGEKIVDLASIQEEYGWQEDAIRAACKAEVGICVIDYLDSKEIEVEVNEA